MDATTLVPGKCALDGWVSCSPIEPIGYGSTSATPAPKTWRCCGASSELDTYRDPLGAALDVHVFHAFNRLGLIMKRLTAVTVIIMIPNFVAGIYGMNFNHFFPPSDWEYGFVAVVAFLACMVAWGFIHSRRLGWL